MRTGVYFCNCGNNIAGVVDPEKVRERIGASLGEGYFKTCPFLCSEEGKLFLEEDLRGEKPQRVVIAACSPREHEGTFMRVLEEAGMNPYLMQMVNLREQVAWVTEDPDKAVEKAAQAIKGALSRVALHEELERREIEVAPEVMVLGAGPAGLKAALTLAEAGRRVVLVEKSPFIGGLPVLYEELFPQMECGPCMMEPLLGEVLHGERAENIELLTMAEVSEVAGYFGNFMVRVRQKARHVRSETCIGCGECVEACPVRAPNPFDCGMGERKAVAFPFPGALPNLPYLDAGLCTRLADGSDCSLCAAACPMGESVIDFEETETLLTRQVGAIVVATGSSLLDCAPLGNLGYGAHPEVKTAHEFERLLASNGPSGGEFPAGDDPPRSVALVHCVGSRDEERVPYCSGICCQYALKLSRMLQSRLPEAHIHHLYREIVCTGKDGASLLAAVRGNPQATFTRYEKPSALSVDRRDGRLQIGVGGEPAIAADLVVLCPAVVPGADAANLGAMLDLACDDLGFFEELHGRIDAQRSKLRGIYLAGACRGPTDVRDAATQGMAAAGCILSELVEGRKLALDPTFAVVDDKRCSGCRVCGKVCPYRATGFDRAAGVSSVNAVLCRGCGTCVAACPSGAIAANHFTGEMILAEIKGALA